MKKTLISTLILLSFVSCKKETTYPDINLSGSHFRKENVFNTDRYRTFIEFTNASELLGGIVVMDYKGDTVKRFGPVKAAYKIGSKDSIIATTPIDDSFRIYFDDYAYMKYHGSSITTLPQKQGNFPETLNRIW